MLHFVVIFFSSRPILEMKPKLLSNAFPYIPIGMKFLRETQQRLKSGLTHPPVRRGRTPMLPWSPYTVQLPLGLPIQFVDLFFES